MTTCKIKWIDHDGNPTPDNNLAIGYVYRVAYVSQYLGRAFKYEQSERYPICCAHARQLSEPGMEHWRFIPLRLFRVTFDITTDESAEHGEHEESGEVEETQSLRDAIKALQATRTNEVDGVYAVEPDCIPCNWPRSIRVINGKEFRTGAEETRTLHIPAAISRASARRIARLCGVPDHCMTLD